MLKRIFLLLILSLVFTGFGQNNGMQGLSGVKEYIYSSATDGQTRVFIAGTSNKDAMISCLDDNNEHLWDKKIRPQADSAYALSVMDIRYHNNFIYGCGITHLGANVRGSFYFKLSAVNGAIIWMHRENTSNMGLTSLSVNNSRIVMAGTKNYGSTNATIKVLCALPADGNMDWQSGRLDLEISPNLPPGEDRSVSISEIVNNKFYVLAASNIRGGTVGTHTAPTLLGFDLQGNQLVNQLLVIPSSQNTGFDLMPSNIAFDGTDSLIVSFFGNENCSGSCSQTAIGIVKTDLNGNVSFAKKYDFTNQSKERVKYMNVTQTGYLLYGGSNYTSVIGNAIALNLDKTGNVRFAELYNKSATSMAVNYPLFNHGGNSDQLAGNQNVFISRVHYGNPAEYDYSIIKINDSLRPTDQHCLLTFSQPITESLLGNSSELITVLETPDSIGYVASTAVENLFFTNPGCNGHDIVFPKEEFGCDSTILSISSTLGIDYELNWANGYTGTTKTFTANTELVVELYNPVKCCEFTVLYDLELNDNAPTINLQDNLTICGNQPIEVNVPVTGTDCVVCSYQWSNGDTTTVTTIESPGTYYVSLTNNCDLTTTDSIVVQRKQFPSLSQIPDSNICPVNFPIDLNVLALHADSIVWSNGTYGPDAQYSGPDTAWVKAQNECGTKVEPFILVDYTVKLDSIDDIDTCLYFDEQVPVTITGQHIEQLYVNSISLDTNFIVLQQDSFLRVVGQNKCGYDTLDFLFNSSFFPHAELQDKIDTCVNPGEYVELPINVVHGQLVWLDGHPSTSRSVDVSGQYHFRLESPCDTTFDFVDIDVHHVPQPDQIRDIDTCLFDGEVLVLDDHNLVEDVKWFGSDLPEMEVKASGTYFAELSTICGTLIDSSIVIIRKRPVVSVPDSLIRCAESVRINELQIDSNFPFYLYGEDGNEITSDLTKSETITVEVPSECETISAPMVIQLKDSTIFYAPTAFTPNGDKHNSVYEVSGLELDIQQLSIFNRWGQKVYQSFGDFEGWDGTHKGEVCPTGNYVLHVTYSVCDKEIIEYQQVITLLR